MSNSESYRYPVETIPDFVRRVIEALSPGEVYLVGGTPRSFLLRHLNETDVGWRVAADDDWDLATSVHPEEMMRRLENAGIHAVPTGIDHGTVTAVEGASKAEVTTYRKDVDCDGRHAVVEFAETLREDLERRDFTVNSLAIDPSDGNILDPFGGIPDLRARVIRTVGPPEDRFREDHLRLIRAIRFAVRINGNIEDSTWAALSAMRERLREVSVERVRDELMKMLGYEQASRGFELLHDSGLLKVILPEFDECFGVEQNRYHSDDVARHTLHVVDAIHPRYPLLRWTALMHDICKPRTKVWLDEKNDYVFYGHDSAGAGVTEEVMRRLRFSNDEIEFCTTLVQHHMFNIHPDMTPTGVRRLLRRIGRHNIRPMLRLRIADRKGNKNHSGLEPGLLDFIRKVRQVEAAHDALSVKDLCIGGKELIDMGYEPGPKFGEVLDGLLEKVLDDPTLNSRQTLLEMTKEAMERDGDGGLGADGRG